MANRKRRVSSDSEDDVYESGELSSASHQGTNQQSDVQHAVTSSGRKKVKTIEERYQKKTQLEHILLRPDTYVGSLDSETVSCWVWSDDEDRMVFKPVTFVPAMFKIFGEWTLYRG